MPASRVAELVDGFIGELRGGLGGMDVNRGELRLKVGMALVDDQPGFVLPTPTSPEGTVNSLQEVTLRFDLRRRMVAEWGEVIERERGWSLLLHRVLGARRARAGAARRACARSHLRVREAIAAAARRRRRARGRDARRCRAGELATTMMALGNGLNLEAFLDEPGHGPALRRGHRAARWQVMRAR